MKNGPIQRIQFFGCCSVLLLLLLCGCSTSSPEKPLGAVPVAEVAHADGFFVVPGADFSRYREMNLPALQFDDVAGVGGRLRNLNDNEKLFFRDHYLAALMGHFIADGSYITSLDAGREVMIVRAEITRIAPVHIDLTDKAHARALERYQSEIDSLTLKIELVDSLSHVLLARLVMTGAVGVAREEGGWMANNAQVAAVFDQALATLRIQLNALVLQSL